jgi:hypothetical protein
MKVLINAIGISNSGGVVVLEKLILELVKAKKDSKFIFYVSLNSQISSLIEKYRDRSVLQFHIVHSNGYLARLIFENFKLRKTIFQEGINLIYNFSGSRQFFTNIPQLVKIHNLMFYSRNLDKFYRKKYKFQLWLKHVFFKRQILKIMHSKSGYVEIQSKHVITHLSDFVDMRQTKYFIKSDIDVCESSFSAPRKYDFSKTLKILYIVGPHFDYPHKNFLDFTNAMLELKNLKVDFEIHVTLSDRQLNQSSIWDSSLNYCTHFHGYITDLRQIESLFCDNTILISTSIVETLGLHVVEAIKNGVISVVPDESYARAVYGRKMFSYRLFDENSLTNAVLNIINYRGQHHEKIKSIQDDLIQSEKGKFNSILDVFDEVINVSK